MSISLKKLSLVQPLPIDHEYGLLKSKIGNIDTRQAYIVPDVHLTTAKLNVDWNGNIHTNKNDSLVQVTDRPTREVYISAMKFELAQRYAIHYPTQLPNINDTESLFNAVETYYKAHPRDLMFQVLSLVNFDDPKDMDAHAAVMLERNNYSEIKVTDLTVFDILVWNFNTALCCHTSENCMGDQEGTDRDELNLLDSVWNFMPHLTYKGDSVQANRNYSLLMLQLLDGISLVTIDAYTAALSDYQEDQDGKTHELQRKVNKIYRDTEARVYKAMEEDPDKSFEEIMEEQMLGAKAEKGDEEDTSESFSDVIEETMLPPEHPYGDPTENFKHAERVRKFIGIFRDYLTYVVANDRVFQRGIYSYETGAIHA